MFIQMCKNNEITFIADLKGQTSTSLWHCKCSAKTLFWLIFNPVIQEHNRKLGSYFTFTDCELVTLICDVHHDNVVIVQMFYAAGFKICANHLCFRICSFFATASIFEFLSLVMTTTLIRLESVSLAQHKYIYYILFNSFKVSASYVLWV